MHESLLLEQVSDIGVVTDEVGQRVKLSAADVEVTAHGRHPEVVDAGASEVREHVRAGLAVALAHQVAAQLGRLVQPLLGCVPVQPAVVPSAIFSFE